MFRPSGKFRGHPVLYRDHRKGRGGPPGGATYPEGPRGLKCEGNHPLVGWCVPPCPPSPAPRVGNPRVGAHHLPWGALHPPGCRPLREIPISRAGAPQGAYIKGRGEGGQQHYSLGRLPPPLLHLSLRRSSAKPCRHPATSTTTPSCCCWSHLPQPLLPPCWIKKEETSSAPYVC